MTSDNGASRQPNSHSELGAAMRFFKTLPLPIPKYVGTVSHPDSAWAAGKPGMILQWACTVALMSISELCRIGEIINIGKVRRSFR